MVAGRNNLQFCGSDAGARAAILYSLVAVFEAYRIDSLAYLRDVLERTRC